jgi:hypothetical protein
MARVYAVRGCSRVVAGRVRVPRTRSLGGSLHRGQDRMEEVLAQVQIARRGQIVRQLVVEGWEYDSIDRQMLIDRLMEEKKGKMQS